MKIFRWNSRRKLIKENEQLREDIALLKILVKAYIRDNSKLQDDIDLLNASLDAAAADSERWKTIAHKADERRRQEYVRHMAAGDRGDRSACE